MHMKIAMGTYYVIREVGLTAAEKAIAAIWTATVAGFVVDGIAGAISFLIAAVGAAMIIGISKDNYVEEL
jgi:hypothetical protein